MDKLEECEIPVTTSRLAGLSVVLALNDIWKSWHFDAKVDFLEGIAKKIWEEPAASGDAKLEELKAIEAMTDWFGEEPFVPGGKAALVQLSIVNVACAFAHQAMKAELNSSEAWIFACEANHWLGILQGTISGRGMERDLAASSFSTRGLDKRHAENRAMKATIMDWCDSNIEKFPSLDKAAEAIAGKEVPISFRTARAWIAEWKKLRSAGKE